VVLDGQTGLLVDERDVDGMARAMIELARDPQRAAAMGAAARARVTAEFSLHRNIARLWSVIEQARADHGARKARGQQPSGLAVQAAATPRDS
jgi:glycosyltransferase involved in cell wall biosynthesis